VVVIGVLTFLTLKSFDRYLVGELFIYKRGTAMVPSTKQRITIVLQICENSTHANTQYYPPFIAATLKRLDESRIEGNAIRLEVFEIFDPKKNRAYESPLVKNKSMFEAAIRHGQVDLYYCYSTTPIGDTLLIIDNNFMIKSLTVGAYDVPQRADETFRTKKILDTRQWLEANIKPIAKLVDLSFE
jgi:hypothetical protein